MANFNSVLSENAWGVINIEEYYPDNYYLNFYLKSGDDVIKSINQPQGIEIIMSSYKIPAKPFHHYMMYILNAINDEKIRLDTYFSEFYFEDAIWAIEQQLEKSYYSDFKDFIPILEEIIFKFDNNQIEYPTIEDWDNVRIQCNNLISKLKNI